MSQKSHDNMILYPERDVIPYREYTPYPEGYDLVASIVNFCDSQTP